MKLSVFKHFTERDLEKQLMTKPCTSKSQEWNPNREMEARSVWHTCTGNQQI